MSNPKEIILWEMLSPSSGYDGNQLYNLWGGDYQLRIFTEGDEPGKSRVDALTFKQVHRYMYTSGRALSIDQSNAYDRLIEMPESPWSVASSRSNTKKARHMRIRFDEGPCYDFAAEDWSHHTESMDGIWRPQAPF